jgi:hypothetical protein
MAKPAVAIELTAAERAELESLLNRLRTAQRLARLARIVPAAADEVEKPDWGIWARARQRIVGMTYSAPARMPVGQRAVIVLRRV